MPAPANDDFANALLLTGDEGVLAPVVIDDATVEVGEPIPTPFLVMNQSIWFKIVPAVSGRVLVTTRGSVQGDLVTPLDTVLAVYTGTNFGDMVQIESSDDAGFGVNSLLVFDGVAATTYWIQAGTFASGETGTILLSYQRAAGDDFADPIVLPTDIGSLAGLGLLNRYTDAYSVEIGEPSGSAGVGDIFHSLWLELTPSVSGPVVLTVSGIDMFGDPLTIFTTVWTGSTLGGLTEVASVDGTPSVVAFEAAAGVTYRIQIGGAFLLPGYRGIFSFSWHLIAAATTVFGGERFYESPESRFIVTDLEHATLTYLDHLALDRSVTISRAAATVITARVPSDNPEINIPAPAPDDEPFVTEGTRFLFWFRREGRSGSADPPWRIRAAGLILDVDDEADSDHATTTITAYDPWKYLYRRPVLLSDGSLPEAEGRVYPAGTRASDIIVDQFDLARTYGDPIFTDWDSGFWTGIIESTDPLPDGGDGIAVMFQSGATLGEMLDTLVATGTCDVVFDPVYDPFNRPGILCDLSVYGAAGSFKPNAIFGWDRWPRNVVQLSRQVAGTERANRVQMYAGQGGPPVPEESDAASIARFREYWALQYLPGVPSLAGAHTIAERQLALLKDGQYTYALSPAAERAPLLFEEYREADTVPLGASKRFRDPAADVPLRIESIPVVIGDDQLERVNQMLVSYAPASGS